MPDAASWGAVNPAPGSAPKPAPSAESREEAEMQSDLARLFAVRDAHLAGHSGAATGLAPLPENGPVAARSSAASPAKPGS